MSFFRVLRKVRILVLVLVGLGFLLVMNSDRRNKTEILTPTTTTTSSTTLEVTTTTTTEEPFVPKRENETLILLWTNHFNKLSSFASWSEQLTNCSSDCRLVSNRRYLVMSDAVLFHGQDLNKDDLPIPRTKDQLWIFLEQTPPDDVNIVELAEFSNTFNWTMTYRHDSDIVLGYGSIKPTLHQEVDIESSANIKENVSNKTKLVAYLNDKCDTSSKREEYVALLGDYISVDMYGSCGDISCENNANGCLPQISKEYKFYLSFEQSLCEDYITELFYNPLQHPIVPVVYGGVDYAARAPSNSYINIEDFFNSKMLADYLIHLDQQTEGYMEYFEWKGKFHYEPDTGWCDLCNKLKQQQETKAEKVYSDLWEWWFKRGNGDEQMDICKDPPYDVF